MQLGVGYFFPLVAIAALGEPGKTFLQPMSRDDGF
jgi:hypothetical protein